MTLVDLHKVMGERINVTLRDDLTAEDARQAFMERYGKNYL